MVGIELFGVPNITQDGQAVKIPRRKSRALVYYLAAQPRPLTREHLLAFFWPDTPRAAAQQVLRTSLSGLRKVLGPALLLEDDKISLSAKTQVDAREFERALAGLVAEAGQLASAVGLYRGDFLSDFYLPDTPAFDDWALVERERYRHMAVRAMASLSRIHAGDFHYPEALLVLERALAFDPLQEDLQREYIRLLYLSGDRPAAIRQYDQLRKLLDDEMGVPPMLETRTLYDSILTDSLQPDRAAGKAVAMSSRSGTPSARARQAQSGADRFAPAMMPFTGRVEELDILQQSAAAQKLALIQGEPGIGKTRLAQEFILVCGALPLIGTAQELEHRLPYQPVIEALRGLLARPEWPEFFQRMKLAELWLEEIGRLLPELAPPQASLRRVARADESRLWEAVRQFLSALAGLRPLVLFIDDLQWADPSTLALLGYLIRQSPPTVSFLAAARPVSPRSELATVLQSLARSDRLTRVSLSRLSHTDILSIAQRLSSKYAYPLAGWMERNSEGNPYVLTELARYGMEKQIIRKDGEVNLSELSTSPVVPRNVYSLAQSRLSRLSEPARRVLDAGVALGREFDFDVVYRAAGLSETAALDAIDELREAGLIFPARERRDERGDAGFLPVHPFYRFDHTLTMEVDFREMGEARHRLLHHRVAEAMEQVYHSRLDEVAGVIAAHFLEGNAPERAAPYAYRAAQTAARLAAWKEAVHFYQQAVQVETNHERRKSILGELGDAYLRAGEAAKASEAFHSLLVMVPQNSAEADDARLALAQTFLVQVRFAEAISLAQQVLKNGRPEKTSRAQFLWGTALSLEGADLSEAAEHLRLAEAQCEKLADRVLLAEIKFELGSIAAQQGDLPKAIDLYRQSLSAAEVAVSGPAGENAFERLILAYNNLAYHLLLMDDPEAVNYAQKGLSLAREKGFLTLETYLLSTLGEIYLAGGDLQAAEDSFNQGLALAEQVAMPERVAGLTANLGLVAQRRGQVETATYRLSNALARADALGTRHLAAQIRLWLVPLLPREEARRRLAEARAIAESGGRQRLLEEAYRLEKSNAVSG